MQFTTAISADRNQRHRLDRLLRIMTPQPDQETVNQIRSESQQLGDCAAPQESLVQVFIRAFKRLSTVANRSAQVFERRVQAGEGIICLPGAINSGGRRHEI